jgi:hypothetical protein
MKTGRDREIEIIVIHDRAVEIAKLMFGHLNRPLKPISHNDYVDMPRRNIKNGFIDVKSKWKELEKICRTDFESATPYKFAKLYELIFSYESNYRIPLTKFIEIVGKPREGRLKGAPLHSTIHLSPWGLSTEFPEMHLVRDLAIAYNTILDYNNIIKDVELQKISWKEAKKVDKKIEIAKQISTRKYHMRMCVICCFNLIESYINGIAWEYNYANDISKLSFEHQKILKGDGISIMKKITEIPKIVTGLPQIPLSRNKPPLSKFGDIIKPFRDSIVHASPYSAPERYGGYDKLTHIYEIGPELTSNAVSLTLEIICTIHQILQREGLGPNWLYSRDLEGRFLL